MDKFHFLRPYFLLAFLPFFIALYFFIKRNKQGQEWSKICEPHLLKHLLVHVGKHAHTLSLILITLVGALMIIALSGPTWEEQALPSYGKQQATVIVLDVSSDMLAQDIKPNRLTRAKYKIQDLLKLIKEGQTGLIVFTSEPFLVSPLTDDSETLKIMLPEISPNIMPVDGTNISESLLMADKMIQQSGFTSGNIVLLTAAIPTPADIATAKKLSNKNIQTSILGVGTKLGAPIFNAQGQDVLSKLDNEALQKLANAGGGIYVPFTPSSQDVRILSKKINGMTLNYEKKHAALNRWIDEGRYLLWFILPLVLSGFRRGFLSGVC